MPIYNIRDVQVEFPFNAYDCQLVYMEKVIESLQTGTNALLESPTGTGKTLCLLCATLAWREAEIHKHEKIVSNAASVGQRTESKSSSKDQGWDDGGPGSNSSFERPTQSVPKIIYASRTHTQLSQTVKELKNTKYAPRVCVLASREQLCIHHEVKTLPSNAAKTSVCRDKVKTRTCGHYLQLKNTEDSRIGPTVSTPIMDIEDLVTEGTKARICPYYLAREGQQEADLLVVPYNYLLDRHMRDAQKISVENAVVIIDEAHNLEKHAEESASFELTAHVMAGCVDDADKVLQMDDLVFQGDDALEKSDVLVVKALLLDLEEHIMDIDLGPQPHEGRSFDGDYIFKILSLVNITHNTWSSVRNVMERMVAVIASSSQNRNGSYLSTFSNILQVAFNDAPLTGTIDNHANHHYKVHVKEVVERTTAAKQRAAKSSGWDAAPSDQPKLPGGSKKRVLSYWCFNPGVAVRDFESHGTHSILLTSGTLSPLSSFATELSIALPVRLENPHVISPKQIWVGVMRKGPAGHALNSSFRNRETPAYKTDLGNAIVNFSRIVPAGLLVFFPSYGVMKSCVSAWQQAGPQGGKTVWERINQHKTAVVEPQDKQEFVAAMHEFYLKVADRTATGAIFFAVCRGKVSEGLDFANDNGRAVIITGMPYPPFKDARVVLKRQYCDRQLSVAGNKHGGATLTGNDWYQQQSARAVNQAIGRVIRHRHDYGAIIFADERFANPASIAQLPMWVRPHVLICKTFGESQGALTRFFKNVRKLVPSGTDANTPVGHLEAMGADSHTPDAAAVISGVARKVVHRMPADGTDTPRTHVMTASISSAQPAASANLLVSLRQHAVLDGEATAASASAHSLRRSLKEQLADRAGDAGEITHPGGLRGLVAQAKSGQPQPPLAATATGGGEGGGVAVGKKRARDLYRRTPADTPPAATTTEDPAEDSARGPTAGGDAKAAPAQMQAFILKLKHTLRKDHFKAWNALVATFQTSPRKRRDMRALVIAAQVLFKPYGIATSTELLMGFRTFLPPHLRAMMDAVGGGHAQASGQGAGAPPTTHTPGIPRSRSTGELLPSTGPFGRASGKNATPSHQPQRRRLHEDSRGRMELDIPHVPLQTPAAMSSATADTSHESTSQMPSERGKPAAERARDRSQQQSSARDDPWSMESKDEGLVQGGQGGQGGQGNHCPHCRRTPRAPFRGPCGHQCCYSCWVEIIAPAGTRLCPVPSCRTTVRRKRDLEKVYFS